MKTIKKLSLKCERVSLNDPGAHYAKVVASSRDVAAIAHALIGTEDQEVFLAFMLDVKNRVIGYTEVARGTVSNVEVGTREVFRAAILQGASGVILVHNHPSGDPSPSDGDARVTSALCKAGGVVDIRIVDHVVIGDRADRFFSFLDCGMLGGAS